MRGQDEQLGDLARVAQLALDRAAADLGRLSKCEAGLRAEVRSLEQPLQFTNESEFITDNRASETYDVWRHRRRLALNQSLALCLAELCEQRERTGQLFGRVQSINTLRHRAEKERRKLLKRKG